MENDTHRQAPILPPHVEDTVQAIAKLYVEHHQHASKVERAIDRATSILGSPAFLCLSAFFVTAWISLNLWLAHMSFSAFDPPPFGWLVGLISLASLFMATLILISQRRADKLGNRREQMNLEVCIISEQKAAKIIALLEELRCDSPGVANRSDPEAAAMAKSTDAREVLEVIQATHEDVIQREPDRNDAE